MGCVLFRKVLIFVLLFTAAIPSITDASSDTGGESFSFITYYWLPGTSGSITAKQRTEPHNVDGNEALDPDNFAGIMSGERWKGIWGQYFELLITDLRDEFSSGSTDIEASIILSTTEFGIFRRMSGADADTEMYWPGTMLDLIGGLRYTSVKPEIKLNPGADLDASEDWFEAFLGGRILMAASRKWTFAFRGDVGGFGVGDSPDLTWNLSGGVDYRLGEAKWVRLGYRVMGIEYEDGGGQAGLDVRFAGPLAAIKLDF